MLSHIYRLIKSFEQDHGIHPNLLHLNPEHIEQLKLAFEEKLSLYEILRMLKMELVVQFDIVHPHVAWTNIAQERIAC